MPSMCLERKKERKRGGVTYMWWMFAYRMSNVGYVLVLVTHFNMYLLAMV